MTTMTTTLPAARPVRWHGTDFLTQVSVLTMRSLRAIVRDPRMLFFSLLQPLVMLTLFSQIFSSIAKTPGFPAGVNYIDYLMPAILVTTGLGSALSSGAGLITDMKNGVVSRLRAMPVHHASILLARSLSDVVRTGLQLVIMLLFAALVFGFDPAGGMGGIVEAWVLALFVSWGLQWLFMAVASWLRNAELMQTAGFLLMFPLMFGSSAYVPLAGLPGWVRAIAKVNPLTYAIDAARALSLGGAVGTGVLWAVVASAALGVIGVVCAVLGFRKPLALS